MHAHPDHCVDRAGESLSRHTIILGNFGGPSALARCEYLVAKLGGIKMELNGFGWREQDRPLASAALTQATRPYYDHTIEQFGPDRCMFEANFPVDMVSCSYNILWNSFKWLAATTPPAKRPSRSTIRLPGSIGRTVQPRAARKARTVLL